MFSENYFLYILIGDYSKVDTPVPIPNTAVKHFNADDSVSENRKLPIFLCIKKGLIKLNLFYYYFFPGHLGIAQS